MEKYIRSERANLFEPNAYIGMVVKLFGLFSNKQLESAVRNAYEANETTMCKITLETNGDAFYERSENSGCKFILNPKHWKELMYESERRPFELQNGELVRTFVTKENNQTVLFIHAHHLVGDGKSILILIQDIMDGLCGKPLIYKPMLSVNKNFLESKGKLTAGMNLYINLLNNKWRKKGQCFTWNDYYHIHENYWKNCSSEIIIETHDINTLKKECPKDITINSYLIARLLSKYHGYKTVGIPISIREDDGMSNQTSGIAIKHKYNHLKSIEENTDIIHKKIYKLINNVNSKYFILLFMEGLSPSLIDAVLLQSHGCYENKITKQMAKVMGYIGNKSRDLGITNLNRISIQVYNQEIAITDILFIPPKISYSKEVIGISTYANTLTICYHNIGEK